MSSTRRELQPSLIFRISSKNPSQRESPLLIDFFEVDFNAGIEISLSETEMKTLLWICSVICEVQLIRYCRFRKRVPDILSDPAPHLVLSCFYIKQCFIWSVILTFAHTQQLTISQFWLLEIFRISPLNILRISFSLHCGRVKQVP